MRVGNSAIASPPLDFFAARAPAHDLLAHADLVAVARDHGGSADLGNQARELIDSVDFPGFVADLINGVFDAMVDTSVRQTKAYADLLKA